MERKVYRKYGNGGKSGRRRIERRKVDVNTGG